jgi:hypothetical protein
MARATARKIGAIKAEKKTNATAVRRERELSVDLSGAAEGIFTAGPH